MSLPSRALPAELPRKQSLERTLVPGVGLLAHEPGDAVGLALEQGWFEGAEQAAMWLWLRSGDHLVDAGAHVGLYTLLGARAVGAAGRVLAIEPDARSRRLLRLNLRCHRPLADRVILAPVALQDQAGSVAFECAGSGRWAFSRRIAGRVAGSDSVPGMRLDTLLERHALTPALLKLDLEGSERAAMDGAGGWLANRQVPLVQVEFSAGGQAAVGENLATLMDRWITWGYQLCVLEPQTLSFQPATVTPPSGNLWAVADLPAANQRLATASLRRRVRARAVLRRSAVAWQYLLAAQAEAPLRAEIGGLRQMLAEKEKQLQWAHQQWAHAARATEVPATGRWGRWFRERLQRGGIKKAMPTVDGSAD